MTGQPIRRARRSLPDLSGLYDSIQDESFSPPTAPADLPPVPASPEAVDTSAGEEDPHLQLPDDLAAYLPPDLWRKLSAGKLRSGVLINALERLRSLLYIVSTYLPGDLVQEKLNRPVPGLVSGKVLNGCLLFSDVSGFTALSEKLAALGPQGAEHLTSMINRYFTTMIEILSWSGGTLVKFAGDATLVYFPEQAGGMHAHWAARTGQRMLRAMQDFASLSTPAGTVSLKMKIGIAAGPFLAASIGSPRRMEYALVGPAVGDTMQAESHSSAGKMVTNRAAADLLGEDYQRSELKPDFFLIEQPADSLLDDFEIRPEKRRARGAIPWSASPAEILAQMETVLHQIQALTPYLASELIERIVVHASQRQVQSEFRPTAVMFCSFSGPEALLQPWGSRGATRVTGLLSAYFNDMSEIITRFGGIVSRIDPYTRGSKLMALFGAPVAHEDDAQRAVSAALAMNAALQALNQRWAKKLARHLPTGHSGVLIEQRIGITLGSTYAGQVGAATRREYTVMGDVVNLAARLMSAAAPGQILVSEPVYESTGSYFITRSLPPVRVKGKIRPVPLFQVDGPREDILLNRIHNRGPLIGRELELARCRQVLEQASQGRGALLALTGPAGIGKSHLADALLDLAQEQDWQVQALQCRSYLAGDAFACWTSLVRGLAGITSIDHPLIQKEKLDRLTALCRLPAAHCITLAGLLGLQNSLFPPQKTSRPAGHDAPAEGDDLYDLVRQKKASRRASGLALLSQLEVPAAGAAGAGSRPEAREDAARWAALAALLAATAARTPLLVFFEDAHWMDAPSRACLRALSKDLCSQPLLFLLAGRPDEDNLSDCGEVIPLHRFTQADTYGLTASILVGELAQIIHEQSGGSPLFVEEISRWIQRTRKIGVDDLKTVLQSSDILQKLVLSSLENLPEGQREVARLASVVGNEFQRSEVECLLDSAPDSVTMSAHLRGLVQARLISLSEAGVDPRYSFAQSIFRGILYNSLPHERRRDLHGRLADYLSAHTNRRRALHDKIAAFLENGPGLSSSASAEVLAHHYEMAEQWLAAAHQRSEAAEQLARQGQPARAEALYQQALSLLERCAEDASAHAQSEKIRAYCGLGDIAARHGNLPGAAAAYEAAELAGPLPAEGSLSPRAAEHLAARLALAFPALGKADQAETQLAQAITQDEVRRQPPYWPLHVLAAWLAWRRGADSAGRIAACRALLPARTGIERLRALAVLDELAGAWQPALAAYQALDEPDGAALVHVRWADALLQQGRAREAGQQYDLAAQVWSAAADPCGQALVLYRRAECAWQAQDAHATLALLEEAQVWLAKSPPALQSGPRENIQRALARVRQQQAGAWDAWQWQPFEDLNRIRYFLPLFPI